MTLFTIDHNISNMDPTFKVGQRYTYIIKETCIRIAKRAKDMGYDVVFGMDDLNRPYFEIVDPFK